MIMDLNVFILFLLLVLYFFDIFYYKSARGALMDNISKIFLLYWLINIFLGVAIFGNDMQWDWSSLIFLLTCVNAFCISYNNVAVPCRADISVYSQTMNDPKKLKVIAISTVLCGFGYVYYELTSNGFGLYNLISEEGLMETGYYFSDGRYGGITEIQVPIVGQILLMINYSGFCFAGYLFKLGYLQKRFCFLQFLPMIASTLATTAKTLLVSGILLWLTGYIVASLIAAPEDKHIRNLSVKKMLGPSLLMLAFFYFSFVIRYQTNNPLEIVNRLFVYIFGHVPCYDDWFAKFNANLFGYSYGQQSFQFLFGPKLPDALRAEYVVPYLQTKYGWTNVNTMFAYFLMDFGYIGSLIVFFIWGHLAGVFYNKITRFGSIVSHGFIALTVYVILYSFLICAMKYTSIVGSFFLFAVYICVLKKNK